MKKLNKNQMKQLLSLLVLIALTATSYAQSNEEKIERSRDVILGGDRRTSDADRSRDVILGRRTDDRGIDNSSSTEINREYDRKIREIRNNPDLTRAEKERIIRRMEQERNERLRKADNRRYDRDRDRDRDNRYGKNKKVKGNNGKHLGWEKGKGNQKKNKNGRRH